LSALTSFAVAFCTTDYITFALHKTREYLHRLPCAQDLALSTVLYISSQSALTSKVYRGPILYSTIIQPVEE
jgi:hypothetical protein